MTAGDWYYVVGEYTLQSSPNGCADTATYPGGIDIWVNGVYWEQSRHGDTGCMSQYQVAPQAGSSAVNIGTMAKDAWFAGAIGNVAIYDHLLSATQIAKHYRAMTGKDPTGTCTDTCTF